MGKKMTDATVKRWVPEAVACAISFIEGRTPASPFGVTPDGRTDLRGLPLSGFYRPVGVHLQGVDFSGLRTTGRVIFAESELYECTFDDATMDWGDYKSTYERISFARATMKGSDFGSKYVGCDFTRTDMHGSTGLNPLFDSCQFRQARMDDSVLNEFTFRQCVFTGVFRGVLFGTTGPAVMEGCDLTQASFPDCTFKHARFESCTVSDRALLFTNWPVTLAQLEERARTVVSEELRTECQHWVEVWRELEPFMPQNLVDLDDLIVNLGEKRGMAMFDMFKALRQ